MTQAEVTARVAGLLDAGDWRLVPDLHEDLAAGAGPVAAADAVYEALAFYRIGCILRGDGLTAPNVRHARELMAGLYRRTRPS